MRKVINLSYTVSTNNFPSGKAPETAGVRRVSRKDNRLFTDIEGSDGLPVTIDVKKVPTALRKGAILHFDHVCDTIQSFEIPDPVPKDAPDTHGCDGSLVLRF